MTAPLSETQRVHVNSDDLLASKKDVIRVDRDVRITSSLGFIISTSAMLVAASIGYYNLTSQRNSDRIEITNLKAQLAGVSAQLASISTDLKIANAVNAARASDLWTAQMMTEFNAQLKDAFKNSQGMDWAQWPVVRSIQAQNGMAHP